MTMDIWLSSNYSYSNRTYESTMTDNNNNGVTDNDISSNINNNEIMIIKIDRI